MENPDLSLLDELLTQTCLDGVSAVLARRAREVDDRLLEELQAYAYGSVEQGRGVDEALSFVTVGVQAARVAGNRIGELELLLARGRIASSEQGRPELIEFAEKSFRSGRDLSVHLIDEKQPHAVGFYFDFTEELARMHILAGRLEEARHLWSEAREHLHGDAMLEFGAAFKLATICHLLHDFESASRYALIMASLYDPDGFRRQRPNAQILSSSDVCNVLYGVGRALRSANELTTAARLFSTIIDIYKDFSDARFQLGFCQMFGADVDAAVQTWKEISESDPSNSDALANYAESLGAVGRMDEALATIEAAIKLKPDVQRLRILRGGFLLSLGRPAEAAEDFATFLNASEDEDPKLILQARMSRARSLHQAGDLGRAIEEAKRIVDDNDDTTHWIGMTLLADLQASSGNTDQAIKTYNEIVDADPGDLSVRLARLDVLIEASRTQQYLDELFYVARRDRDPKAALQRLEKLLASHPQDRELKKLRAYANLQAVSPDLAEEELTLLLAETPNDADALNWRGVSRLTSRYEPDETGWNEQFGDERIQNALSDLAGAVVNAPDNQEYQYSLLWLVDRALGDPLFRFLIQFMSAQDNGLALAIPGLQEPIIHYRIASELSQQRRWAEAVAELTKAQDEFRAMGLKVSAQRIYYQLADNRLRLNQLQQAMDDIKSGSATLWMHNWPLTPYLAERWEHDWTDRESQRGEKAAGIEIEYVNVITRLLNLEDLFYSSVVQADILSRIGRGREAVTELEKIRSALENIPETLARGVSIRTLLSLVWIYRNVGELARAQEVLEQLRPFVDTDDDRAVFLGLEGTLLEFDGHFEEAYVKYHELQPIASKLGHGLQFVNAMQLAGNCCEREAFGDALEVLDGADIDATRSDNDLFTYHLNRARALHGLNRADEALPEIRAALAIVDDLRSHFTLYESRTSWLGRGQRFFEIGVRIAADAGEPAEAFLLAEKSKARTFLDQLVDAQTAAPSSANPLQSTLRNVNELREVLMKLLDSTLEHGPKFVNFELLQHLQELDASITVLDTGATEGAISLSAQKLRDELRKVETAREDLERRIEEQRLTEFQTSEGAVGSFEEVRVLLESEEQSIDGGRRLILAEYYVIGESTLLFLARSDFQAPQIHWLNFGVSQLVANSDVVATILDAQQPKFSTSFDQLFAPIVEPILSVAKENDVIWIVPHSVLHYFPLHLVRIGTHYLCEQNPVFYSPSASVLHHTLSRRQPRTQRAIVFGDPGNDLPFAREEAITVSELLGATPHLGSSATKENLLNELERGVTFDFVHLACHGYFESDDPMESGVVLASSDDEGEPTRLTAEELFRVRMSTSLVALSACETGRNFQRKGDELVGLSRALFRAGAASVLLSSWAVDDVATTLLLGRFYRLLEDEQDAESSLPKCDALWAAQTFVRELSAADLIEYCDVRLGKLSGAEDSHRAIRIGMVRARAQVIAGDLEAAAASFDALDMQVSTRDPSFADLRELIDSARNYLSAKLKRGALPKPDYDMRPFDKPYFWGGFVLQGDWR